MALVLRQVMCAGAGFGGACRRLAGGGVGIAVQRIGHAVADEPAGGHADEHAGRLPEMA